MRYLLPSVKQKIVELLSDRLDSVLIFPIKFSTIKRRKVVFTL